ncbi:MAG: hypothetical protein ABIJ09_13305 [Pseudomonadota bacterium]
MRHVLRISFLVGLVLILAACGPSYLGTFVDPSGSAWVTIRPKGEIVNAMGDRYTYKVAAETKEGTTLQVTDGAAWHAEWRVTADGKELHGASSPAKVVFRRR